MLKLDINKITRIHFIGVGGIGMSALARHFLTEKKIVSGSDVTLTPITKTLASEGVQVFGEQVKANITKDIELVVYTEAMSPDHEELKAARDLKIPTTNYFEALGLAMNPYYLIAIAGTHGKTTTTAMITDIFEVAEKDPTAVIGSLRAKTQSNYRAGKSKYAIVEACEYKRDFMYLKPDVLVITNVEYEHVDYYKSLEEVQLAFRDLANQVNEGGVVIANLKEPSIAAVLKDVATPVRNYMMDLDLELGLKQPGLHNRLNAAAAASVAKYEKISDENIAEALEHFAGTWRRFEYKGTLNDAPVYDDYAHHPTEIRATIDAARELYPERRIVLAFQPHTHSRTAALFDEFAKSLGLADAVVFLPIYAARKETKGTSSSRELSVKSLEFVSDSTYADSLEKAEQILRKKITAEDVLVVMGAGDVSKLATNLIK